MSNRPSSYRGLALRWLIVLALLLVAAAVPAAAGAQGVDPEATTSQAAASEAHASEAHAPTAHVPAATASASLVRSAPNVQGCGFTTVDIWLNDVVNAYGADVRIQYDPTKILVVDADTYSPGTQVQPLSGFMQPNFLIRKVACNALDPADALCDEPAEVGTIWYAFTQVNPTVEVSGSGAIARITFRALGAGLSPLDIYYTKVSDRNGVSIPTTQTDSDLTAAPLTPPATVAIQKLDANTARLSWGGVTDAATYRIFRSTAPYFAPSEPAFGFTSGLSYEDPNALGSTVAEYFYIVKSACSDGFTSADSNRTGAWDYDLVPGS